MSYDLHWQLRGTLCKCKKVTYIGHVGHAVDTVDTVCSGCSMHSGCSMQWKKVKPAVEYTVVYGGGIKTLSLVQKGQTSGCSGHSTQWIWNTFSSARVLGNIVMVITAGHLK